jgi:hypothetical protein
VNGVSGTTRARCGYRVSCYSLEAEARDNRHARAVQRQSAPTVRTSVSAPWRRHAETGTCRMAISIGSYTCAGMSWALAREHTA